MKVSICNTTIEVDNAYAERENGIITLFLIVPYSEMEYADLKALCKSNTGDIIKTSDDATETFSGFSFANISDDDAKEVYTVKLTSNEYSFQLGRNRQLEADNEILRSTVSFKDGEISALNGTIAELQETIAGFENGTAGDGLLTDIAAAIEEGVNEA